MAIIFLRLVLLLDTAHRIFQKRLNLSVDRQIDVCPIVRLDNALFPPGEAEAVCVAGKRHIAVFFTQIPVKFFLPPPILPTVSLASVFLRVADDVRRKHAVRIKPARVADESDAWQMERFDFPFQLKTDVAAVGPKLDLLRFFGQNALHRLDVHAKQRGELFRCFFGSTTWCG